MNIQVNPEILQWARRTAGLDVETAARGLGFQDGKQRTAAQRLLALEEGDEAPSVSVLDRMAMRYRRPTIVFYLPNPPVDEARAARLRSAPKDLTPADEGRLNAFVRVLRGRQNLLREALVISSEWTGSDQPRRATVARPSQHESGRSCAWTSTRIAPSRTLRPASRS